MSTAERLTRPTVPALDTLLGEAVPVLDHGFVRLIDYMGDDAAIVQAARVSYGKGTKSVQNDRGLIRYLMRHHHTTPFEMCEIKFHVKMPIFVARQWIRHRTANVNEYSARYSILDREFYIPEPDQLAAQSVINNQGRGDVLQGAEADEVRARLEQGGSQAFDDYLLMLNERPDGSKVDADRQGLARELARMSLPLNTYTQFYWKIDLHNLLHFLRLRADSHAQYEIRVFADAMYAMVKDWVPFAAEAFEDYRMNAFNLSGQMRAYVAAKLRGEAADPADFGLTARELRELEDALA